MTLSHAARSALTLHLPPAAPEQQIHRSKCRRRASNAARGSAPPEPGQNATDYAHHYDTDDDLGHTLAPDDLLCPITKCIMRDPVLCADGNTYERKAITKWLGSRHTSPITRATMAKTFVPNIKLQRKISDWRASITLAKELQEQDCQNKAASSSGNTVAPSTPSAAPSQARPRVDDLLHYVVSLGASNLLTEQKEARLLEKLAAGAWEIACTLSPFISTQLVTYARPCFSFTGDEGLAKIVMTCHTRFATEHGRARAARVLASLV